MEDGRRGIEMGFPSFRNLFLQYFLNDSCRTKGDKNSFKKKENALYFLGNYNKNFLLRQHKNFITGPLQESYPGPLAP